MKLRVPFDQPYVCSIGKAIYIFAYYEWAIIYIIQQFKPKFVAQYSRGEPLTSGSVLKFLQKILTNPSTNFVNVSMIELQALSDKFQRLIEKRNALIHAHPITDNDGLQILHHQKNKKTTSLPDIKWRTEEVEEAIAEFDAAACEANTILYRLLNGAQ